MSQFFGFLRYHSIARDTSTSYYSLSQSISFAAENYHISSVMSFFFFLLNNPKNLDPSYKMDLDLWDCLGRVKLVLWQNFIGLV